jgi:hypothetical protein
MPSVEDAAARRARHADAAMSAVVAAAAAIVLAVGVGVRGLGLFAGTVLAGSAASAVLTARRAGWHWTLALRLLLAYAAATAVICAVAWAVGYR